VREGERDDGRGVGGGSEAPALQRREVLADGVHAGDGDTGAEKEPARRAEVVEAESGGGGFEEGRAAAGEEDQEWGSVPGRAAREGERRPPRLDARSVGCRVAGLDDGHPLRAQ